MWKVLISLAIGIVLRIKDNIVHSVGYEARKGRKRPEDATRAERDIITIVSHGFG